MTRLQAFTLFANWFPLIIASWSQLAFVSYTYKKSVLPYEEEFGFTTIPKWIFTLLGSIQLLLLLFSLYMCFSSLAVLVSWPY